MPDANGNLTGDGPNSYTYDMENRLIGRGGAITNSALFYDPLGRLSAVNATPTVAGSAGITRFLHDGDALVAEYDCAGSLNCNGNRIAINDIPTDCGITGRLVTNGPGLVWEYQDYHY